MDLARHLERVGHEAERLELRAPSRSSSALRNATSKGALWMRSSAPDTNSRNSSAMSPKRGLSCRSSTVRPCTSLAAQSMARSGFT
jgi:hypothetical protein